MRCVLPDKMGRDFPAFTPIGSETPNTFPPKRIISVFCVFQGLEANHGIKRVEPFSTLSLKEDSK